MSEDEGAAGRAAGRAAEASSRAVTGIVVAALQGG